MKDLHGAYLAIDVLKMAMLALAGWRVVRGAEKDAEQAGQAEAAA